MFAANSCAIARCCRCRCCSAIFLSVILASFSSFFFLLFFFFPYLFFFLVFFPRLGFYTNALHQKSWWFSINTWKDEWKNDYIDQPLIGALNRGMHNNSQHAPLNVSQPRFANRLLKNKPQKPTGPARKATNLACWPLKSSTPWVSNQIMHQPIKIEDAIKFGFVVPSVIF